MTSLLLNIGNQTCRSRFIHQNLLFFNEGKFFSNYRSVITLTDFAVLRFGPPWTWVRSVIFFPRAPWITPEVLDRFRMQKNRFLRIEKINSSEPLCGVVRGRRRRRGAKTPRKDQCPRRNVGDLAFFLGFILRGTKSSSWGRKVSRNTEWENSGV